MPDTNSPSAAAPQGVYSEKLLEIASRAKAFTGAVGATIALTVGDQFITCVACGTSPKHGAPLRLERNFTQLCPASTRVLCCNDIDTDSRIDSPFYRTLKIKSLVIAPLGDLKAISGVLAVFSGAINAFTGTHVAMLKTLAEVVTHMLATGGLPATLFDHPAKAAPLSSPLAEVATASTPLVAERSTSSTSHASSPTRVSKVPSSASVAPSLPITVKSSFEPRPGHAAPRANSPAASANIPTPRPAKAPAPRRAAPKAGTSDILDLASDPLPNLKSGPARTARNNRRSAVTASTDKRRNSLGRRSPKKKQHVVASAAIAIVVLVALCWPVRGHRREQVTETLQPSPQMASNAAVQPSNLDLPAAQTGTPLVLAVKNNLVSTVEAAALPDTDEARAAKRKTLATKAGNASSKSGSPRPLEPVWVVHSVSPDAHLLADSNEEVPQPDVNVDANPMVLDNLVATSRPALPVLNSPKIVSSEVIFKVAPIYPADARLHGIDGTVVLSATVTKNGSVTNVRVVSGLPSLCNAAKDALRQWRYKPSLIDGAPVDSTVQVVFHFHTS